MGWQQRYASLSGAATYLLRRCLRHAAANVLVVIMQRMQSEHRSSKLWFIFAVCVCVCGRGAGLDTSLSSVVKVLLRP